MAKLNCFRGAMVGAVIGDCLGAPFEYRPAELSTIINFFKTKVRPKVRPLVDAHDMHSAGTDMSTEQPHHAHTAKKHSKDHNSETATESVQDAAASAADSHKAGRGFYYHYTDDTAMARSVAGSLIRHQTLDITDMAKRFVKSYNKEPYRGYGSNVGNVFLQLESDSFQHPHGPASEQFDGAGSMGNGGAMRIAPAALYGFNMTEHHLNRLVTDITRITHSHADGINGAILQCAAVQLALRLGVERTVPHAKLDAQEFIDRLLKHMEPLENPDVKMKSKGSPREQGPFCTKLLKMKEFLNKDPPRSVIEEELGCDVTALTSVPTAIYCFLRCSQSVEDLSELDLNGFTRTVVYAVSLGGDADTIASMAAAIAGAYYGIDDIPAAWRDVCEGTDHATSQADKLHDLSPTEMAATNKL